MKKIQDLKNSFNEIFFRKIFLLSLSKKVTISILWRTLLCKDFFMDID